MTSGQSSRGMSPNVSQRQDKEYVAQDRSAAGERVASLLAYGTYRAT